MRAGTGLFAASDEVAPQEFDRFVQQIELQKNYPGIQGIGFSQRLRADEKADLIAKMQPDQVSAISRFGPTINATNTTQLFISNR